MRGERWRIGWLRGAALVVALMLGAIAGAGAASLVADTSDESVSDPLTLGADLANQSCTGDALLVVARGDSRPALRAAVADNPGASYLDTAASCPTLYAPLDTEEPAYVVFLGPYDSPTGACEIRMTPEHQGDYVTSLRAGNQTYVKCACELSAASMPVLTPGLGTPTTLDRMWIHQLQGMLVDLGRIVEDEDETGDFDATTVAAVRAIQTAEQREPTGVVDAGMWEFLKARACRGYDY